MKTTIIAKSSKLEIASFIFLIFRDCLKFIMKSIYTFLPLRLEDTKVSQRAKNERKTFCATLCLCVFVAVFILN